jgi:hypothetical protein
VANQGEFREGRVVGLRRRRLAISQALPEPVQGALANRLFNQAIRKLGQEQGHTEA